MFCVGYGSSFKASALTPGYDAVPIKWYTHTPIVQFYSGSSWSSSISTTYDSELNSYYLNNSVFSSITQVKVFSRTNTIDSVLPFDVPLKFVYYFYSNDVLNASDIAVNFLRSDIMYDDNLYFNVTDYTSIFNFSDSDTSGIVVLIDLPSNTLNFQPNGFRFISSTAFTIPENCVFSGAIYSGNDITTSDLISAIQQQTDKIVNSIEDQYSGDPGSSFPVDDIITQHNEKMGVLSFSSEALMQVLGLLSPDQTLSSELVFPSMSLTIAGQRNKVQLWPEYRFDLNTLKQHWPNYVGIMQSLTTALVWIFVLRYCYRVFEKYFLAGGGN